MANDLNELNSILFDTLRGVESGKKDVKQANAVIGISNALINNAKVQLQAIKLSGRKGSPDFFSLPEPSSEEKGSRANDKHDLMMQYAVEIGCDSVAHAFGKVGKDQFIKDFESWIS